MKTTMKKSHSTKTNLSKEKIDLLCQSLSERITDILDYFDIEYEEHENRVSAPCPVHGGDKTDALTVFTSGDSVVGNWYCWTQHCEKEFINTVLGLIRGILSNRKDKKISFTEAVEFATNFLNMSLDDFEVDNNYKEKVSFISCASNLLKNPSPPKKGVPKELVRKSLQRPVKYYLDRGFQEETLDLFDVGICASQSKLMYNRIVVPVYDDNNEYMVGCVGRSLEDNPKTQKWINSKGFNSGVHLYNYSLAKNRISETSTIILVEGQGDVWRLWEAGIKNAVGIFGCNLTDFQLIKIEKSGALNIVVMTDNDEAGKKASKNIQDKCERLFNMYYPTLKSKDVGDMSVEDINQYLKPQLDGII